MKKVEIKKEDIIYNLNLIKTLINSETKIIAVVKANGMGLGLEEYSKFLVDNGVEILAVADVDEAIKLRNFGIKTKILMLTPICLKNELKLLIENDITITFGNIKELEMAKELANELEKSVNAHIKIDTGFGRYGILYSNKEDILELFKKSENIKIEGMFTHFSNPMNEKYTKKQFDRFNECISFIEENGFNVDMLHACATTSAMKYPYMQLNAVRIGSAIQGRVLVNKDKFKRVGTFKTNIQEIKDVPKGYNISYNNTYKTRSKTKIAIVPVGYIDGLNRNKLRDDFSLKNNIISAIIELKRIFKTEYLKAEINGKKFKIIGKLGMYHAIIDITGEDSINIGDEVILNITPIQAKDEIRREYI